ncbi:MAG TPA: NADH:ubiquinone reductase (Na(+)-transporting) subunit A, partial [Nitrospira sp.]|nr:NADH:ubiquinone reductase (Na(+)-transporting) subunit A [Nitrospira sp.]
IEELIEGEVHDGENRIISGSVLSGRQAVGWSSYLGRHHLQISVIQEGVERTFLGWF